MQTIESFLNNALARKARLYEAMTDSLRIHLPVEVATHCWVGGVRAQSLVVVSDSACFSTIVHYQQHEILEQINSDFQTELRAPLTKLRTKIAQQPVVVRKAPARPLLSATNAHCLTRAAINIIDPELRSALARLAQRGGKYQGP
jgi:hypothetical protein